MFGSRITFNLFVLRRKSNKLAASLIVFLTVYLFGLPVEAKYSGGTGKPNDPYQIVTAEEIILLGETPEDYGKHFILTADIDLDPNLPGRRIFHKAVIAPDTDNDEWGVQGIPFTGVFDGNNKKILNFTHSSTDTSYIGLFGCVDDPNAQIKDLRIIDPNINAGIGYSVGSLVGWLREGAITNCYAHDINIVGTNRVGGLVGRTGYYHATGRAGIIISIEDGILIDCHVTGNVSGTIEVGGLVGSNLSAITNCHATVTVAGDKHIGGLVGVSSNNITTCYSMGLVIGTENVGGLSGYNSGGSIFDSNSASIVKGKKNVGGLVGKNDYRHIITNCSASGNVSGTRYVGGLAGYNNGSITNTCAMGIITGDSYTGGLVGINFDSISSCFSTANVTGQDDYAGGLAGDNNGTITNCYSSGSVTGSSSVGGLLGYNGRTVINCYAIGTVVGKNYVGGLIGHSNMGGSSILSFWDIDTSGQLESSGGTGKTTLDMQEADTFQGWGSCVDKGIWTVEDGKDYPRLSWEDMPGVTIEPILLSYFLTGAGTEDDAYLIYTADQLNVIGLFPCDWDKHFKLMADVDMSFYAGKTYNIIGSYFIPFTGTFDGNGHNILNFKYRSINENLIGLFGCTDTLNAQIKNLGLIDPNIGAGNGYCVGSIVGYLKSGTLTNCYAENVNISGYDYIGGLVGENHGIVIDCYSNGNIKGDDEVGGLVGLNFRGTIENCYSMATVTGDSHVGGLIGSNGGNMIGSGTITNSYSVSDVSARAIVGGLAGTNQGTITDCYSNGQIVGEEGTGGLSGYNFRGTIKNSYSAASVFGKKYTGGLTGFNYEATVMNCCFKGNVNGSYISGGIVGRSYKDTIIKNCYSTGNVYGFNIVGGLVGWNGTYTLETDEHVSSTITNCYSTGSVMGSHNVGGLVGDNSKGEVTFSFWDIETSGQSNMCGIEDTWTIGCDNTYGKITAEMQQARKYLEAGWDFVGETENGTEDIWWILEGQDYPRLWWEAR